MLCPSCPAGWNQLSEPEQLQVTRAALLLAMRTVTAQAELFAAEMEHGLLANLGGADALRLLAIALRGAAGDLPAAGYSLAAAAPAGRA